MVPAILDQGRTKDAALVAAAGVGQAIGAGLAAFATRDIFWALHGGDSLPHIAVLSLLSAGLLIVSLRIVSRTLAERLGQDFAASLRQALYTHLSGMNHSDIAGRRAGALGLRFVGDLSAARLWAGLGLTQLFSAGVVLPGAAIALCLLNPSLAAAVFAPIMVTGLIMLWLARAIEPLHRSLRSKRARIAISMMERVAVAADLDIIGRSTREAKRLNRDSKRLKAIAVARARAISCLRAVPEGGLSVAGISLMTTAFFVAAPAAEVAGALAVLGILFLPIRDLAGVWDRRCAWAIARHKCEVVFAKPSHRRRRSARVGSALITFDRVEYRGLNLNLSVHPGEVVLFSGAAGSGKSSVLALAAGLDAADAGTVSFNERARLPVIAVVGSRAPILQGSLRRALCLGVEGSRPANEEIVTVAAKYGLAPLIDSLGGLDARVGEAGRNLSSGEKTRLLLARAELTRPDLIIVDAADIALDLPIAEALRRLVHASGATALIACNTGQFTDLADRHFRIEQGRLVLQF